MPNFQLNSMQNLWYITNITILGYLILLCLLGTFYKHISFGAGLGDVLWYMLLFLVTFSHLCLTLYFGKTGILEHTYLVILFLIISIYISLKATLWRGAEYRWNGSLFYLPCPKTILINNGKTEKPVLVRMCSMEYYSTFTGVWTGKEITNINGDIKIPEKVKKYIKYPIQAVLIKSDTHYQQDSERTEKVNFFDISLLNIKHKYKVSGEVISILEGKPLFKVRVKDMCNE